MTAPQDTEVWIDAVAKIGAQIAGIASGAVYAAGTGGQPGVQPMVESLAESGLPAFVLSYGGAQVTPGDWERQTHTLEGSIWLERAPLAERYAQAIGFIDAVMAVFPSRGKPTALLQSVLVTEFKQLEVREWPEGVKYLVLPFSIQVVRNRSAQYAPAGP